LGNPNGCFDWYEYTDDEAFFDPLQYASNEGPQMEGSYNLIQKAAGLP